MLPVLYWYGAIYCLHIQKTCHHTKRTGNGKMAKNLAPKNPEKYSPSNCYFEFYSYLQPLGRKTQKSDWPLGAPPTKQIKIYKIVQKYPLSYWNYGAYSYFQPVGRKTEKTDWALGNATYQKIKIYKIVQNYCQSYLYYGFYSYLQPFGRKTQKNAHLRWITVRKWEEGTKTSKWTINHQIDRLTQPTNSVLYVRT